MKRFIATAVFLSMLLFLIPITAQPISLVGSSDQDEDEPEGDDHPWGGEQIEIGLDHFSVNKEDRIYTFSSAYPSISISIILLDIFFDDIQPLMTNNQSVSGNKQITKEKEALSRQSYYYKQR
jgi:hypothetical protein